MEGRGVSSQSWLNQFKIAIIDKDTQKMDELNSSMPEFETIEQICEAQAYIKQAIQIIVDKQSELRENMAKIQKTKKFLNS